MVTKLCQHYLKGQLIWPLLFLTFHLLLAYTLTPSETKLSLHTNVNQISRFCFGSKRVSGYYKEFDPS